ncbi:MAG: hypothetical protein ABL897_12900, partial [Hyphomicrobium sp.]
SGYDSQQKSTIPGKDSYKEMSEKLAAQRSEIARTQAYQGAMDQKEELLRLYNSGAMTLQAYNASVVACNQAINALARTKGEQIYHDHGVV